MPEGEFFVPNMNVETFLPIIERVLTLNKFKVKQKKKTKQGGLFVKAIWGSRFKSHLMRSLIPFADFFKGAQRAGCEAYLREVPNGLTLRMAVVPYTELFDQREVFLLSQGIIEKFTDNRLTNELWQNILNGLLSSGVQLLPLSAMQQAPASPQAPPAPTAPVAGTITCPICGASNPADAKFCASCGHKLK
ncbi:MAG: zinc ribbon domain-containing protein [Candidatus Asgardarchaeia archaeon]